ncbi:TPA: hypothetical protein DIV55_06395 [Patescibacteria group bacterium]|uniref:IrrE N-terminal-like domain-containing protein n=1 Tax=Candidatus Gottesmanbacteria bacterium GW2011_GWA1_43_11 TaxID=1618436 RepID=A0A0G1CDR2_9BACT|nr:MAG: hypothetical protein UV59_C0034G0003 [Candidatus Gottesmanbacteria bacterium GW2011_GWA1_43_11]HCS79336.1 hypothetical protein [Patescibacteria group bacterium]
MAILSKDQILSIESSAQDVLLSVFDNLDSVQPPIDIFKILKKYNLKLQVGRFKEENIAGAYKRLDNTIFVNSDDPYPRQVFTIAHELGHHFLHNDKNEEVFLRTALTKLDGQNSPQESEANWFAASLLMPKKLILKYWELTHDVEKISAIFGVSPTAVYFRLKNLQLL